MSNTCYKVLAVENVKAVLQTDSINIFEFDTCLKTNACFAYYLKSGEVVLLPSDYSAKDAKGIIFANKKCFFECIEKDRFPIDNLKMKVEEKYGQDIENIDKNITAIIGSLALKYMPEKSLHSIDSSTLDQLLRIIKHKKLSEKELFYAALTLGQYVKEIHHGEWIILKKYGTFNPYYVPAILYPDGKLFLLWDYLTTYFRNSTITPEIYAHVPYVQDPPLTLKSDFIKKNFFGYKIFN